MNAKKTKIIFTWLCAIFIILACGLPGTTEVTEAPATEAPATEVAVTEAATEVSAPSDQSVAIQHQTIPVGLPEKQSGQAGDFDSSNVLENGSLVGGDRFTFGRFERPFNSGTMDNYFSQLDIVSTMVHQDDIWIYGSIVLKELTPNSSSSEKYALELDTDIDGKGDWIVIAVKPSSTEWTVNGVQIYEDANNDVGLEMPMLTDENVANGDGFESQVFDQGQGNDADSAWVRISPNDANTIEFSVKQSALGSPSKYLINMWAGTTLLDPARFDFNDEFTHEQAGAADKGLEFFYPIKEVSEIDNTCRMAVGFQPNGSEPGICPVPELQQGDPVPPGASCPADRILVCTQTGCFCFQTLILIPIDPPPPPPR